MKNKKAKRSNERSNTSFETLRYGVRGRIATITLNRPERLNAIDDAMPGEIRAAVERGNADDAVHVIVLAAPARPSAPATISRHYAEGDAANRRSDALGPDARLPLHERNTETS